MLHVVDNISILIGVQQNSMTDIELRKYFTGKKQRVHQQTGKITKGFVLTKFEDFKHWIGQSGIPERCFYCGFSAELRKPLPDANHGT
jgi:biotin synthase-like enzyme